MDQSDLYCTRSSKAFITDIDRKIEIEKDEQDFIMANEQKSIDFTGIDLDVKIQIQTNKSTFIAEGMGNNLVR